MEYLDIVDDNDNVVGKAPYKEVYEKFLPHRIVHILLFNEKGEMALQLRAKNKYFFPNFWSTAVGGHVQSGETPKHAALREYEEEIGANSEIEQLGPSFLYEYKNFTVATSDKKGFHIGEQGLKKIITAFRTRYDGQFTLNPEEVEKIGFFSMDKVKEMIKSGEKFHPELLFLLKKHFNIGEP